MVDYTDLKDKYPSIISAEQLYQICHISKRKAKWLLENGVIPCIDTGKKTIAKQASKRRHRAGELDQAAARYG